MDRLEWFLAGFSVGIISGIFLFGFLYPEYKRGQIDSLTGNIKYELITNPDSTRTWKEIPKKHYNKIN